MAAWLAYLKSKLLLPREAGTEDQPTGDELAARLAFRLKRLEAMRNAAARLMTRKRLGRDIFARGMPEGVRTIRVRQYTAVIYDLLKAYAEQRRRTAKRVHVIPRRTVWSIKEARQRLEALVGRVDGRSDGCSSTNTSSSIWPTPMSPARRSPARSARRWRWRARAWWRSRKRSRSRPSICASARTGAEWQRVS